MMRRRMTALCKRASWRICRNLLTIKRCLRHYDRPMRRGPEGPRDPLGLKSHLYGPKVSWSVRHRGDRFPHNQLSNSRLWRFPQDPHSTTSLIYSITYHITTWTKTAVI